MRNLIITGGTGSLGNELCKQILTQDKYNFIDKVIVFSRDEQKQEVMHNALSSLDKSKRLRFFIGDIRDYRRLYLAIQGGTDIIHCAALKIVPAMEYNPMEAVKTNILGTQNIIESVSNLKNQIVHVTAVSTDKAVYPVNLYGATKLAMEKLIVAANNIQGPYGPLFSVVRYGNVAGSRGSVIPLFKSQIIRGEPLTITDPNMTRFWITIERAARFVLNRHFGEVLPITYDPIGMPAIPPMKAFRVVDLAHAMAGKKYKINYTGKRPGEKLAEFVYTNEEAELWDGFVDNIPQSSDRAELMSVNELRNQLKKAGLF